MVPWQRLAKDYDKARPRTYHGSTCKEVREEKRESNAGQVTTGAPMFLAFSSLWHSSSRTLLPLDRVSSEGQEKEVLSTHHEVQAFMTACKDDDEQWPVLQELIRKVDVDALTGELRRPSGRRESMTYCRSSQLYNASATNCASAFKPLWELIRLPLCRFHSTGKMLEAKRQAES